MALVDTKTASVPAGRARAARDRPRPPRRTIEMNLGPQHPAMHGTLRARLTIDGETIVKCDPDIGFLHTGFEKLGEYRTFNQFITVTDRMNYFSPICNNVGFAVAVEELVGIEVPPRGQYVRVIMAELTRIADHVLSVGLSAMDMGAFSVMLWGFIQRERLYDVFEAVTGARLTTSWTRVGGIFRDVPDDFRELIIENIKELPALIDEIELMLDRNKIWLDRTKGVGVISQSDAIGYGLTGPLLRASGIAYDVRRARPYLCYNDLDFEVVTETAGDVFARYKVRLNEMRESYKIVHQALDKLPSGPVNVESNKVVLPTKDEVFSSMESLIHHFKLTMGGHGIQTPVNEIYSCTESPTGELGFYLVSDGSGIPYKVRIRPPAFFAFQIYGDLVEGLLISDSVAVLSSFNVIAGEVDR